MRAFFYIVVLTVAITCKCHHLGLLKAKVGSTSPNSTYVGHKGTTEKPFNANSIAKLAFCIRDAITKRYKRTLLTKISILKRVVTGLESCAARVKSMTI